MLYLTAFPWQDVIKDMKRRFKFMNHQIEQLKDEITIMDHCLVRWDSILAAHSEVGALAHENSLGFIPYFKP